MSDKEKKRDDMKEENKQKDTNVDVEVNKENKKKEDEDKEEKVSKKEYEKSKAKEQELNQKVEELERQVKDLKDQYLRKAAEFENYKRRTENDQMNLVKYAAEPFILKILQVYDDFNRSMGHINEANDVESIKQGLNLVFDKFKKTLEEEGVKKIEAKGQPFNVDYHEALMQQQKDDVPHHTVIEEIEPGYMYKDKVIRHAKVIVSQGSSEEESGGENEN
jgi:molecular chaperone GrpE